MKSWMQAISGYSKCSWDITSSHYVLNYGIHTQVYTYDARKLTKREELSFLVVCAFPNASRTGLDMMSKFLTFSTSLAMGVILAKYLMMIFDASVLPAPLSPISNTVWHYYTHTPHTHETVISLHNYAQSHTDKCIVHVLWLIMVGVRAYL